MVPSVQGMLLAALLISPMILAKRSMVLAKRELETSRSALEFDDQVDAAHPPEREFHAGKGSRHAPPYSIKVEVSGSTTMKIGIVIASYCKDDLRWISQLPCTSYRVYIYNKCERGHALLPPASPCFSVTHLPNRGRDSHTHLTHIVQHHDTLQDMMVFLQGTTENPELVGPVLGRLSPGSANALVTKDNARLGYLPLGGVTCDHFGANKKNYKWFQLRCGIFKMLTQQNACPMHPVGFRGQFAVSKERLQRVPPIVFAQLADLIEMDTSVDPTGYSMERLWSVLLGCYHESIVPICLDACTGGEDACGPNTELPGLSNTLARFNGKSASQVQDMLMSAGDKGNISSKCTEHSGKLLWSPDPSSLTAHIHKMERPWEATAERRRAETAERRRAELMRALMVMLIVVGLSWLFQGFVEKHVMIGGPHCLSWIACTCVMVVSNKWIFAERQGNFPYFFTLTFSHMVYCTLATAVVRWLIPKDIRKSLMPAASAGLDFNRKEWIFAIVPIGALSAVAISIGNSVYTYISVALVQLMKAGLGPLLACLFSFIAGAEQPSTSLALIVTIVCFGNLVMFWQPVRFMYFGFGMQLVTMVVENTRLQLLNLFLDRRGSASAKIDPLSALYLFAPVACICTGVAAAWFEWRVQGMSIIWDRASGAGWYVFAINGVAAVLLNLLTVMALSKVKVMCFVIVGVVKDWILVGCDMAIFQTPVMMQQLLGLVLTMFGIYLYAEYKEHRKLFLSEGLNGGMKARWQAYTGTSTFLDEHVGLMK